MSSPPAFESTACHDVQITHPKPDRNMNTDPGTNVFVFEVQQDGAQRRFVGHAPTRAADGLQQVWAVLGPQTGVEPRSVQRLYSEWELSRDDTDFARRSFPAAQLSFSFARPADDGWDAAMAAVAETIRSAATKRATPPARSRKWWQLWK